MPNAYCPNCQEKNEYKIRRDLIKEFKGNNLNVEEQVPVCSNCGQDIFIPEIEEENLNRLYNKYREVADIVSPNEIFEFRTKYNISQRELVAILDWGKMTINRYEKGAIPSSSHNDMLKIIMSNEMFFKDKVEEAFQKDRINEKSYDKIQKQLNNSINDMMKNLCVKSLFHKESEFNGFRKFDIERLTNLIAYLADKVELYKTSLNKYLWYIDFENFRRYVRSITGTQYMKYTHGPIIENFKYNDIINLFDEKFYVIEKEQDFNTITIIKSKKNYDLSLFKEEELEVINDVIEKFKTKNCSEISNYSHEEDGWLENKERDLISYNYATNIKVEFGNH
jgi:putative zinc finger/helix-turn-helix YgiT family protein